jgi:flavin reductase (DIM6/NTAB) family NADH-FMN oxidoreductase RutF
VSGADHTEPSPAVQGQHVSDPSEPDSNEPDPSQSDLSQPDPSQSGPEEADDSAGRRRRRVLWRFPTGLYVLGSRAGDRRNLMTASWVSQVSMNPTLVGVGVERVAVSHALVEEGGVFALSLVARAERASVRRFVKPVELHEVDVDAAGRGTIRGTAVRSAVTGAPVLLDGAAYVDCVVREAVTTGSHTWFVGEVVDSGFGPGGEDTEVLRMEDTRMHYGG